MTRMEAAPCACWIHRGVSSPASSSCVFRQSQMPLNSSKLTARGKAILPGKVRTLPRHRALGESPLKIAPPMRDIYARFAPQELQQELLEGKVSKTQRDAANRILPRGNVGCHSCVPLCSRRSTIQIVEPIKSHQAYPLTAFTGGSYAPQPAPRAAATFPSPFPRPKTCKSLSALHQRAP